MSLGIPATSPFIRKFKLCTPEHAKKYTDMEPHFIGLIRSKASRWANRGSGDYEELVQHARCHAMCLLDQWNKDIGAFHKMLGTALDNEFFNLREARFAGIRTPHVTSVDAKTGEVRTVRCTISTLDIPVDDNGDTTLRRDRVCYDDEVGAWTNPELCLERTREAKAAKKLLMLLKPRLTVRQRKVLDLIVQPSWDLFALVRNLTGQYDVTHKHIATFLDLTPGQVDGDVSVIRREMNKMLEERGINVERDLACL